MEELNKKEDLIEIKSEEDEEVGGVVEEIESPDKILEDLTNSKDIKINDDVLKNIINELKNKSK